VGAVDVGGPVEKIFMGFSTTCALLESGGLRCWGQNYYAETGCAGLRYEEMIGDDETPAECGDVELGTEVAAVAPGEDHTCILTELGTVRCWGSEGYGQLGYGNTKPLFEPSQARDVEVGGRVTDLYATRHYTCARLDSADVRCWGDNRLEDLGYAIESEDEEICLRGLGPGLCGADSMCCIGDDEVPAAVAPLDVGGAAEQIEYESRDCIVLESEEIRCRLGREQWTDAALVRFGESVRQVSATWLSQCVLLEGGSVRCWGSGAHGQLGYGNTESIPAEEASTRAGPVPLR
jgi:alpha-tubulin suppressor-like RCC1 family protein